MTYAYAIIYHIPVTGIRLFTPYTTWRRPDMVTFLFMLAILKGEAIRLFNHGNMERNFTYIDDIVDVVLKILSLLLVVETPYAICKYELCQSCKTDRFSQRNRKGNG